MRIPGKAVEQYDLSALRLVTSVGEPLNAEAVWWGLEALGGGRSKSGAGGGPEKKISRRRIFEGIFRGFG
jgi:acyl-coenzyme A synthetase/AMP-(fatty) acid ligase